MCAREARSPLRPGSGVIDALSCNLSLILDHFYNLFETFFITQNVIKLRHVPYCHIQIIKNKNKQQSLAGRIDKLGGPEFENHCSRVLDALSYAT